VELAFMGSPMFQNNVGGDEISLHVYQIWKEVCPLFMKCMIDVYLGEYLLFFHILDKGNTTTNLDRF